MATSASPPLPLPSVTGSSTRHISILLINPNSTPSMTAACLASLAPTLPPDVTVHGFTAPHPSPSAIEGHFDGVLSSAASIRAVLPLAAATAYDAYLVACFSHHPLTTALREELAAPVIGIMEASLYAARMLGARLGVVATGDRSRVMHEDAIRAYGFAGHSVGCEVTGLGVLELEVSDDDDDAAAAGAAAAGSETKAADPAKKNKAEVLSRMASAATRLRDRGADCICLGCAGMTDMKAVCETAVGGDEQVQIIDGVGVGVQFLVGLVREGHKTAKGGVYRSSRAGRERRGQDWV